MPVCTHSRLQFVSCHVSVSLLHRCVRIAAMSAVTAQRLLPPAPEGAVSCSAPCAQRGCCAGWGQQHEAALVSCSTRVACPIPPSSVATALSHSICRASDGRCRLRPSPRAQQREQRSCEWASVVCTRVGCDAWCWRSAVSFVCCTRGSDGCVLAEQGELCMACSAQPTNRESAGSRVSRDNNNNNMHAMQAKDRRH